MPTESKWTPDEVAKTMKNNGAVDAKPVDKIRTRNINRTVLVVGTGDGGCNIASAIRKAVKTSFAVTYNTSDRGMDAITTDEMIIPDAEDGSGKARSYSQEIFKKRPFQNVLNSVNNIIEKHDVDYILVTSTTDGGTGGGVSPMVAKLLHDNTGVPVIIIGVYPSTDEDAMSQYNALQWQSEVGKTGLPYMLFDNTDKEYPGASRKLMMHSRVNQDIVDAVKVLVGEPYGESNISQIDNRDMFMLLNHLGNRIVVAQSTTKPTINQTLDDYFMGVIASTSFHELPPSDIRGIGLFVKAPKQYLESMSTALPKIRSTYGEPMLQYVHMEEANDYYLSLVMTGCSDPAERLLLMRNRYEDVKAGMKNSSFSLSEATDGMDNLVGKAEKPKKPATLDLSALDL